MISWSPLRGVLIVTAALVILWLAHGAPARRSAVAVAPRNDAERALTLELGTDVWSEPGEPLVVVLSQAGLDRLTAAGIPHELVVADLAASAAAERQRLTARTHADWFAEYRDGDEIAARMASLAARHPELATLRSIGTSLEGRPIHALDITRNGKLDIVLDGGHHAREWISVMVPICIADRLVERADQPRIRRILDAVRFHIVPIVNPDGYAYTWTTDRYWRKNRRGGYGVDLNRNYSVAWGEAGSSADRDSPNYRGDQPFSEPESRAMATLFDHTVAHIDFHSFSQLVLYPWSHKRTPPARQATFAAIAERMSRALSGAHGERYRVRAGSELTVGSSGTLGDWAYGTHDTLSFLVELRPASGGGFVLPPEQIIPTCDEGLAAVLELAEAMIP